MADTAIRARLVATWVDHECGCSSNEHGAWIVSGSCLRHQRMVPEADLRRWFKGATLGQFGPFRPQGYGRAHA